jgi:membrane protein DedA with SNARE-associated domain
MSAVADALLRLNEAIVGALGHAGLALIMLLEGIFPPVPSEPFLLAAGLASARGTVSAPLAVLAAAVGSSTAATIWYGVARALPEARLRHLLRAHGRWLLLQEHDLDKALLPFDRHRRLAVFVGRFLPVGRMLVSLPAGLSGMPLADFLLATFLGSLVWSGLVVGTGRLLGEGGASAVEYLAHYTVAVSAVIVALVLLLVARLVARRVRRAA